MSPITVAPVDLGAPDVADRVVEIQRAAYAVEAELIGFDGIPPLHETSEELRGRTDLHWLGAYDDDLLVAVIGWVTGADGVVDIDRLAVHPSHARRGIGRRLVGSVPAAARTIVSTGAANAPARALYEGLGFVLVDEFEVAPDVRMARFAR